MTKLTVSENENIAFFLQNLDGGGTERAIVRLAGEIAELGHPVSLVVGDANSVYRDEVSQKINLIDFSTRSPFGIFFKLISYLRHNQPFVVMSALDPPNIMLILAARLFGFKGKSVVSQRATLDASLSEMNRIRKRLTWLLISACFPQADAVISNSHAVALELEKRLGIPANKIFTIHNAIDIDRIKQLAHEPLNNRFIQDNSSPIIISVGRLAEVKDMATLIRAFSLVKEQLPVRLIIVGEGPERTELENLIQSLGLIRSVYLAGFDVNPYKWIAVASVFVGSSITEGFPNAIAESMALGCPVVATDCPGGTAELLGHGKWGRLVPVGDARRMADAILATLADTNLPDISERATDFSPSKNAAAYLDVLLPEKATITPTFQEKA